MNKFVISGRITNTIDIRHTNEGTAVARFNFAVNRRYQKEGEDKADFFTCVAFKKTAETLEKCHVGKGTKLLIDGEMRNNNYTDKDGVKHYGNQVIVNSFEFCESKKSAESSQVTPPPAPKDAAEPDDFMRIPDFLQDEELPF